MSSGHKPLPALWQCRPRSMWLYGITRLQWGDMMAVVFVTKLSTFLLWNASQEKIPLTIMETGYSIKSKLDQTCGSHHWQQKYESINSITVRSSHNWISVVITLYDMIWVGSWRCDCLVTWFCYQKIAKPGNKTATLPWPDPYRTHQWPH